MLEAVRDVARHASESELARARERLAIEQSNAASLPQLSALWQAFPSAENAERQLDVLVSVPLGTLGSSQANDELALGRLKRSMDLRMGFASLLRDAMALSYELRDTVLVMKGLSQVRKAWAKTIVLLDRLPAHGPERNLLQMVLLLEQDRLDQQLETVVQRRRLLARKLSESLDLDHLVLQEVPVLSPSLQVHNGVASLAIRPIRVGGPGLWRSALAGVQLQTGVKVLWMPRKAQLGYYLGVSYAPVSRRAFRSLRTQTHVHRLEQDQLLRSYASRRKILDEERRDLVMARQRMVRLQQMREASRAKELRLLEQEPSEVSLPYLTHRVDLIRLLHRRYARELRALRRMRLREVKLLESQVIVQGPESIECVGVQASMGGTNRRTAAFRPSSVDHQEDGWDEGSDQPKDAL